MLPLGFFLVALFYSLVGFGGGSSYLALLTLFHVPYALIPILALICNLIVVSGSTWQFYQKKMINLKLIRPLIMSSVPMSFIGGLFPLDEKTFLNLLSFTLIVAGLRLWLVKSYNETDNSIPSQKALILIGGMLGLLSGLVGIGGGIFLAPILLNLRWGKPKEVAAVCSLFILLNSLAGISGHLIKSVPDSLVIYWPLLLAVFLGGQIGSRIGVHPKIPQLWIQRATAVLVLFIAFRLVLKA